MPLANLKFKPGINKEVTSYSNEGGWIDGDKIRFRFGYPEKIGGWSKVNPTTYLGTARALHSWVALDGSRYLGVGTNKKYYIEEGQQLSDITPVRTTISPGVITFSATNGSATITVSHANHGAVEGDYVTYSGVSTLGGNITAAVLNKEHEIVRLINENSYEITASATATSSDTGDGSFTDSTVDISDGTFTLSGNVSDGFITDATVDTSDGTFTLSVTTSDGTFTDSTVDISDGTTSDSTVDITLGSSTLTMDNTTGITAGNVITASGVPSGTTVSSVTNSTTIVMSQNATLNGTNITATFFNETTAKTVTMDSTSAVTAGDTISGTGIPSGTTVSSVDNGTTLTISQAATADSTNMTATFFNLAASKTLTLSDTSTVTAGDTVTGTGIPANTTVSSVDDGTTLTISQSATADGTVTGTFFNLASSKTITMDDTSLITAGDGITGAGIPANTTVASVDNGTTLTLSQSATADATNITATFFNVATSKTITVSDSSAVTVGDVVTGTGIPANTTVSAIPNSTTLTISESATADGTGVTLSIFNDAASKVVTMDSTALIAVGFTISGTGIASGTTVSTISSGVQILISQSATADSTNMTATFNGTTAVYQINTGLDSMVGGNGWGSSTWGRGTWGSASELTTTTKLRTWSHDNFGEDLIINPRDSGIYYWDRTNNLDSRAVNISTLVGANQVPTVAKQIMVSDTNRHVLAFGTNPQGSSTQDPMLIRFSDQESITNWNATATTTAGDLRLGSGSEFIKAIETKREILVWTDTALSSLRFLGPPFTFGLQQLSNNITIMGPNAATATEDVTFWMGVDSFYMYAGQTQQLPCAVKAHVFDNFNLAQKDKVVAGINSSFSEIWWFYPSLDNSVGNGGTGENDKYVVYNYAEQTWYYGDLVRTAWLDRGIRSYPVAAGSNGYLYDHEFGYDDDGSAITSYIESAPIDIGDGDKFVYIRRVLPDLTFTGSSELSSPQATFTLKAKNFPGGGFQDTDAGDVARLTTSPVETFTNQLHVRSRGRSFALRVDSDALGTKWKLGTPKIDQREDGKR